MLAFFFSLVVFVLVVVVPLLALVLAWVAVARSRRLVEIEQRLESLEQRVGGHVPMPAPAPVRQETPLPQPVQVTRHVATAVLRYVKDTFATIGTTLRQLVLETEFYVGQRLLAALTILSLVLAAVFFLRHAFRLAWLVPQVRVAIGLLGGAAAWGLGYRSVRQGAERWGSLLLVFAALLLYTSTYAAQAYYNLIDPIFGSLMLVVLSVILLVAAVALDSVLLAIVTAVGALLIPALLRAPTDAYVTLFVYLTVLGAVLLGASTIRRWPVVPTVVLLGIHMDYWLWYMGFYHTEKLGAVLAFLSAVFALFFARSAVVTWARRGLMIEHYALIVLNALLGFWAAQAVLFDVHPDTRGAAALLLALVHLEVARWASRSRDTVSDAGMWIAVAAGLVAWGGALWFDAPWVGFGWAVTAALLYFIGHRASIDLLRFVSLALFGLALVWSVWTLRTTFRPWPYLPVINRVGLPTILVPVLVLASRAWRSYRRELASRREWVAEAAVTLGAILAVCSLGATEFYRFFSDLATVRGNEIWRQVGQVAVTLYWMAIATVLLVVGFRLSSQGLRWCAIVLYLVAAIKTFLLDLAWLSELYRSLALVVLGIGAAVAVRLYMRMARRPGGISKTVAGESSP